MSTRFPGLTQEVMISDDMLAAGLRFMSPASRTYLEVLPNYVVLHLAVRTAAAEHETVIIPAGLITEEHTPQFATRGVVLHETDFVSVLWGPSGQVSLEGRNLRDGTWLNGKIEAKRRPA